MNCQIGILISDSIKVFFKVYKDKNPECVFNIEFTPDNYIGSVLCDYLKFDSFNHNVLIEYCKKSAEQNSSSFKINKAITELSKDSNLISNILKNILISKGFDENEVNDEISKNQYQIQIVDPLYNHKSNKNLNNNDSQKDTTKFSFDGGKTYYNKRRFVLNIIRQYVKDNPFVTFDELEKVFPSEIRSKRYGVVRPLELVNEWTKSHPDLKKRYFLSTDDIITLHDGKKIVVYNQWGDSFPNFLEIANKLYDIVSSQPYIYADNNEDSIDSIDKEESRGITISEDSFIKFQKTK